MFSLSAILINVLVAGMDFSEKYDNIISSVLIVLNVVVIVIIAGRLNTSNFNTERLTSATSFRH